MRYATRLSALRSFPCTPGKTVFRNARGDPSAVGFAAHGGIFRARGKTRADAAGPHLVGGVRAKALAAALKAEQYDDSIKEGTIYELYAA